MTINLLEAKHVLDTYLGTSSQHQKSGEISYFCPFCGHHKKKLQVNLNTQKWHCWVCNSKGQTLKSLLKKSDAPKTTYLKINEIYGNTILSKENNHKSLVGLPEYYKPLWIKQSTPDYKNALHYATNIRKLTLIDILQYQIGYCEQGPYAGMLIVPSYDKSNMINFYTGRSYYDTAIAHKNPPVSKDIIGFENQINWKEPVTLVEGVYDAIMTKRNAIPLFGKIVPPAVRNKILSQSKKIYIALDKDAFKAALTYIEYFMNNGIEVYYVNLPGKDPSELGYHKMNECKNNAVQVDFSKLMQLKLSL